MWKLEPYRRYDIGFLEHFSKIRHFFTFCNDVVSKLLIIIHIKIISYISKLFYEDRK